MADKPAIEEAKRIVGDEITKGMIVLAAELVAQHGPVKALVISQAVEPFVKALKECIGQLPPAIAVDVCEFASRIMMLGVSAGKGFLAMIEEIEKQK